MSELIAKRLKELNALVPGGELEIKGTSGGLLDGLSFVVKDLFDVAGYKTSAGNPDWLADQVPAPATAPLVLHLLDAGASLYGKATTDDFACGMFGENRHYGTPLNPRYPDRVPGGSSSGSVSAVAGGAVDFSIGTDTGGSVRVPASFCGIYSMRPSHGAVNINRCFPLCDYFDTGGWFARSVELLEQVGDVILTPGGTEGELTEWLIASDVLDWVEPSVGAAFRDLFARLELKETADFFSQEPSHYLDTFWPLMSRQLWNTHREWFCADERTLAYGLSDRLKAAAEIKGEAFLAATFARAEIAQYFEKLLGRNRILLLPTAPGPAPLKGDALETLNAFRGRCVSMVGGASLAGLPQINLPALEIGGGHVGLSLVGPRGMDRVLLRTAHEVDARLRAVL
jgi:amidase